MINGNTSGNVDNNRNGLFIVFEGGEGSGKSTQARLLSKALCALGIHNHLTREPGDTELGADLREILLKRDRPRLTPKAEAFLFAADRAEHVEKLVRPALDRGDVVICDRYIPSSLAYQAYGGNLPAKNVLDISDWASGSLYPDIVFLLDIPVVEGLKRAKGVEHTAFEDREIEFHERVRNAYLGMRNESFIVLDAMQSLYELHRQIALKTLKMYQEKVLNVVDQVSTNT